MQLVINTYGASLRTQGKQFLARAGDKKLAISAHKVQSILLSTAVRLSTDAIELAIRNNIDLVFLGRDGDPCLDFGLYRVQKSVFLGDIAPNRVEEVLLFSRELLDLETDSVYVFPMCREDFERVRIVGQGFDRQLVADEVLTKVI